MTKEQMEACFGCEDIEEFCLALEKTFAFRFNGPAFCAISMMSDAQEQIAFCDAEGARKTLNRAKYLLEKYGSKA